MPRPIVLTEEIKQKAKDEFADLLAGMKMSDGKISYSKSFKYENAGAVLWLSPLAYRKTMALVTMFPDEVAWHGLTSRLEKNEFIIEDIFVYPQEVTGSTVTTDQERYTGWLYEFDDDVFATIRMQGHSHVNMGVSPSGVDNSHREKIISQLEPDMFYIFMIWNKSLSVHSLVYDMENNILYENSDIAVKLLSDDSMDVFLADAMEKVQRKKPLAYKAKRPKGKSDGPQGSLWDCAFGHGCDVYDPYE